MEAVIQTMIVATAAIIFANVVAARWEAVVRLRAADKAVRDEIREGIEALDKRLQPLEEFVRDSRAKGELDRLGSRR